MKHLFRFIVAFFMISTALSVAQEQVFLEPSPEDEAALQEEAYEPSEAPPPDRHEPFPPPLEREPFPPPVERWMEHLRDNDPEAFEHFHNLQTENPDAFRKELRERLREKRSAHERHGKQEWRKHFEDMPEHERKERMRTSYREKFQKVTERKLLRGNPEIRELEKQTKTLAQSYRKAESQEEKETIRTELSNTLNTLFDLRSEARKASIDKMQKKLTHLQGKMAERESQRDAIIGRRLQDLLDADTLIW